MVSEIIHKYGLGYILHPGVLVPVVNENWTVVLGPFLCHLQDVWHSVATAWKAK